MEQKNRQANRLGSYDYGEVGCYFITLCTHDRQHIFEIENRPSQSAVSQCIPNQIIHRWLCETQKKFGNIQVDKYVIMPDHLHFLISITERHAGRSLPDMMRFFKTMTTNAYIKGVKSGSLPPFNKKLWQKSYYDHVIRNQQDYNEVWEYIENNPLKWMLAHNQTTP